MKKTIFLVSLFFALIIAGCNEKNLVKQIDGNWHVQKYAVAGADQTHSFDSSNAGFVWNFSGGTGGSFSKAWNTVLIATVGNKDTVAHYDTMTHAFVIDSVITSYAVVPVTKFNYISGDWYLINGNEWLQTRDSATGNHEYQIIDHSKNSLHLLDGNIDYYLSK